MKNVYKGFVIVLIMTILSKIASFIAELIIAYLLGTTEKADVYSMIIGIHQVIYPMLSIGIWSVFLPMYKKMITKESKEKTAIFLNKVVTFFTLISIVVIFIIILFADGIVMIITSGFSEEMQKICATLLRIYSPYFMFVIISSIYAAVLQSHDNFFGSQLRELVTYLPTILLGPVAYQLYDVYGLVIVLVIGSMFRLLVLLPFLKNKTKYKIDCNFKDDKIKKMIKKMPSVLITSGIEQINILIDKVMASHLVVGSVSGLSYGNKLINVFNGLFTSSITTASYPTLTQLVAENKTDELKKIVSNILIIMAIVIVPISILAIIFREEIVTIVFARGQFNDNSIKVTSSTFMGYLIGMYYIGVKSFTNNVFYSFGDTNKIMKMSFVVIIFNIIMNIVLTEFIGVTGLAIATSISCILYFILTTMLLKRLNCIDNKIVYISLLKIYIISMLSALIVLLLKKCIYFINYMIRIIIVAIIYMIIYILLLLLIKLNQTNQIIVFVKNKLKKEDKNGN